MISGFQNDNYDSGYSKGRADVGRAIEDTLKETPEHRRANALQKMQDNTNREYRDNREKYNWLIKCKAALEDLVVISDHDGYEKPIPYSVDILRMRRFLGRFNMGKSLQGKDEKPIKDNLLRHMWFDFSSLDWSAIDYSEEAINFGREMIRAGALRLPFDTCCFLTSYRGGDVVATGAYALNQGENAIHAGDFGMFVHRRKIWVCGHSEPGREEIEPEHILALLALGSRATTTEQRAFNGRLLSTADALPTVSYRRVILSKSMYRASHGGTHASPRLHWRRGHQRRLRNGTTIWIRPTLVGDAKRGIVLHDYSMET